MIALKRKYFIYIYIYIDSGCLTGLYIDFQEKLDSKVDALLKMVTRLSMHFNMYMYGQTAWACNILTDPNEQKI